MRTLKLAAAAAALLFILPGSALAAQPGLWKVYIHTLSKARYIDLTHDITPNMPVWKGFGPAAFGGGARGGGVGGGCGGCAP